VKWLPDVIGLGGFVALCAGVHLVAGPGWALIVGGLPPTAFYLWREWAILRARSRGRS
jgi:hypothetical protein